MSQRRIVNIAELEMADNGDGKSFVAQVGRAGAVLGSTGVGYTLTVVPPGKRAFPFHRHHVIDELFYVIEGEGSCRIGDASFPIRAGDLIAAPAGTEAHQIVNTLESELRYLGFSTLGGADIVEYPDAGKMAAAAGIRNGDFRSATYKTLGRMQPAGYFDGEGANDG